MADRELSEFVGDGLEWDVGDEVFNVVFGTSAGEACEGNDSRLTNARTPTSHAASHLPGGSDALTTAAAGTIAPDDTAAEGSASSFARSDHRHAIAAAAASANPPGTSNAEGVSSSFARADHTHALAAFGSGAGTFCQGNDSRLSDSRAPSGSAGGDLGGTYPNPTVAKVTTTSGPTSLTVGAITDTQLLRRNGTNIEGVAAAAAAVGLGNVTNDAQLKRAANDFASFSQKGSPAGTDLILIEDSAASGAKKYILVEDLPAGGGGGADLSDDDPVEITPGDAADGGASTDASRSDHTHPIAPFGTGAGEFCEGNDARLSDDRDPNAHASTHNPGGADALATATAGAIAPDDSAAEGSASSFARSDHRHSIACATAVANPPGSSSAEGNSSSFARANHTHELAAFGSSAATFCEGNDSRLSDSRAPNGSAGGDLGGSYPNPSVAKLTTTSGPTSLTIGAIADGQILRRSTTNVTGISVGTSSGTLCAGDDSRLTDSRAPNGSAGGDLSGTYPNPVVSKITTSSGPTSLTVGAITDTQLLRRNGTSIEGVAAAAAAVGLGNVTNHSQLQRANGDFSTFSNKASPTTSDVLIIEDAAASGAKKYITIGALPGSVSLTSNAPTTIDPDDSAAVGSGTAAAKDDHQHAITCAAAVAISTSGSNAEGSASSFARSDHTHVVLRDYSFFSDQLDNPVTADWAVNSLAAASACTNNSALTVRRFANAAENGVGAIVQIPTGATNIVFGFVSRAETTPAGTVAVVPRVYVREFPDNAAVESWSAGTDLTALSFTTNELWQYDSQSVALATLSLVAPRVVQIELTRRGSDGSDTLTVDWTLLNFSIGFT